MWPHLAAQVESPVTRNLQLAILSWEGPWRKEKTTSSILAWRIPGTVQGYQGYRTQLATFTFTFIYLPGYEGRHRVLKKLCVPKPGDERVITGDQSGVSDKIEGEHHFYSLNFVSGDYSPDVMRFSSPIQILISSSLLAALPD